MTIYKDFIVPFLQGLKETGYVEGQNVAVSACASRAMIAASPILAIAPSRTREVIWSAQPG